MGYDLHVTRAENWLDSSQTPISRAEWNSCFRTDPELKIDGYLELDEPTEIVVFGKENNLAMYWYDGGIVAKNPTIEGIKKMVRIAAALNARVQGSDGEFYGPDGEPESE